MSLINGRNDIGVSVDANNLQVNYTNDCELKEKSGSSVSTDTNNSRENHTNDCKLNGRSVGVVVINPYTNGYGDIFLGLKITEIFKNKGYIVEHITVGPNYLYNCEQSSTLVELFKPHNDPIVSLIEKTEQQAIYVAPANIFSRKNFRILMSYFEKKYNINTNNIFCLNEMGMDYKFNCSEFNLTYNALGFKDHQLGYIEVPTTEFNRIHRAHNTLLDNLLDSLNLSVSRKDHLFVAYLTECETLEYTSNNISLFINNSQFEYNNSNAVSNYVILCKAINHANVSSIADSIIHQLNIDNYTLNVFSFDESGNSSFTKPIFTTIVNLTKKHEDDHRIINVFLGNCFLYKDVFYSLICAATDAMVTGDQSLSEFISFKGFFPYYNTTMHKSNLVKSVLDKAKEVGGEEFEDYMSYRFSGSFFLVENKQISKGYFNKLMDNNHYFLTNMFTEEKQNFNKEITNKTAGSFVENQIENLDYKKENKSDNTLKLFIILAALFSYCILRIF
jgi:hypothetical protein